MVMRFFLFVCFFFVFLEPDLNNRSGSVEKQEPPLPPPKQIPYWVARKPIEIVNKPLVNDKYDYFTVKIYPLWIKVK